MELEAPQPRHGARNRGVARRNSTSAHRQYNSAPVDVATLTAFLDFVVEIVRRSDQNGFHVLPRRWVVERTFGW